MEKKALVLEGPEAASRMDAEVRFLLGVPRAVLLESAKKRTGESVENNPKRRGPKRKVKLSASPDPAV